ncbi:hypothetical protein [Rhizobium mongolense]
MAILLRSEVDLLLSHNWFPESAEGDIAQCVSLKIDPNVLHTRKSRPFPSRHSPRPIQIEVHNGKGQKRVSGIYRIRCPQLPKPQVSQRERLLAWTAPLKQVNALTLSDARQLRHKW